jgi:phosphoribosylformylglycinamidine synthase
LKETIFAATQTIRAELGDDDWCVSVFQDNAGVVRFDDRYNVSFKVETHNRPSAVEPYGGANTGIGGVIRDTLGTGLGAKPICNTDVFCFAPPDTDPNQLPPGVLHPRRIFRGVVAGVRDYGNRMGIPTVNGAIFFDERYVGNPLVFCGSVGLIPADKSAKEPQPNDLIVSIGGRTGRDGIHGATFSSVELTDSSEVTSGGAVQIGNAITEKMLMDVLLAARDRGLYNAVTDCGAGGYSSAVGEMGESIGAEVWLDRVPLKYAGLSYTEIWISEAQERMVLAVPVANWNEFQSLCQNESVEATVIGLFKPGPDLVLTYESVEVGRLSMQFLHKGRPPVVRQAVFRPLPAAEINLPTASLTTQQHTESLLRILGSFNVASKHWVIRQYDHEVQGGSVIKPLVGACDDGPSDAAVVRPILSSHRGLAVACGMSPGYGDFDPYWMAANSIDEAIRNCVAVGADPDRIAILDNFCWGYTDRPETLGTLVRAALACYDTSIVYRTPFISGKDSLNNEFSFTDSAGVRRTISIPATLLISALGQVRDVRKCVTMDFKKAGNLIFQIGATRFEMGGSHWARANSLTGGQVPIVDAAQSREIFLQLYSAIQAGLVRSAHDMSDGGLAVCAAEMAVAGRLGAELDISDVPVNSNGETPALGFVARLFSESSGRFLCEVTPEACLKFEHLMGRFCRLIGRVHGSNSFVIRNGSRTLVESTIDELKFAWQTPLDW